MCDSAGFLFFLPSLTPSSLLLAQTQRYRLSAKIFGISLAIYRLTVLKRTAQIWVFDFSLPQSWRGTEETAMAPTKIPTLIVTLQLLLASRTPP